MHKLYVIPIGHFTLPPTSFSILTFKAAVTKLYLDVIDECRRSCIYRLTQRRKQIPILYLYKELHKQGF